MNPIDHFKHCPRCGHPLATRSPSNSIECAHCHFLFYFNPAVAVAAFVLNPTGQMLFIRRGREPAKGKLALPGGFVDYHETAEEAVRRETREEVNLHLDGLRFLCSRTNSYHYHGVTYLVLDFFFVAETTSIREVEPLDGVESICWIEPGAVDLEEIAFPSIRQAFQYYLELRSSKT